MTPDQLAAAFFIALGAISLGLGGWAFYEAYALATGRARTISQITAFAYLKHPAWWVTIACLFSFAGGALVTHFTHWTP